MVLRKWLLVEQAFVKFDAIEEVYQRLARSNADVNAIDGVRVSTADGWWLLRASNTQPALVARCEAKDTAGLARLKNALVAQLSESRIRPPNFYEHDGENKL